MNSYLEKIVIYANDAIVGDYRPTFDKATCQLTNEERHFGRLSTWNLLRKEGYKETIKHLSNCLVKTFKHRKEKPYSLKMNNINIKLYKNKYFGQYVIFFTLSDCKKIQNTVYLELCSNSRSCAKRNVANSGNKNVSKKRRKPMNYKQTIPLNNIYEACIKKKLKHCLRKQISNLSASAIFNTGLDTTPKMFVSKDIKKKADISNFIKEIRRLNPNKDKIMNHNICLDNIQSFVIVNRNKKYLYIQVTNKIKRKIKDKTISASQIIQINNKEFINATILKAKLLSVKWRKQTKKTTEPDVIPAKSMTSVASESIISIQEYSFFNIRQLMQKYEENITTNLEVCNNESTDRLMRDTYKLLVELQLNAIEQCHQLYFNYFTNKRFWPKIHVVRYTNEIKSKYDALLKLQNKAIESSVHVNKSIVNVNKFLKKLWDTTMRSYSQSEVMANNSNLIVPARYVSTDCVSITNVYQNPKSANVSSAFTFKPRLSEIQVQTSGINIDNMKVITLHKCCSPIVLQDFNKKTTQTDISVNKNTSIDFGGKQIQICKRNINIKLNNINKTSEIIPTQIKTVEISPQDDKMAEETPNTNGTPNLQITASEKDIINKIYSKSNIPKQESMKNINISEPILESQEIDEDKIASIDEKASKLKIKMDELSAMLKKIQNYKAGQDQEEILAHVSNLEWQENLTEMETEKSKNDHEVLLNIKNTLEMVKEKFEKNSIILKQASDLKDNYMISNNIQKLMDTGPPKRPKFIKVKHPEESNFSSTTTVKSVNKTKEAIAANLNTSLQLLKNLNEVTKNIKSNPENAMEKLSEIEESIQLQKRLTPRLDLKQMNLTLVPIKNFIASNKMKVSNNAVRAQSSNSVQKSKKIDSSNMLDISQKKPRKKKSKKIILKTDDASPTPIVNPTPIPKPIIHPPAIQPPREPVVPKIYRPINGSKELPEAPKLSDLTLSDVAPLEPEYPRKDNLKHVNVEKTYLYKLLNNSFSEKNLEPLINCSNVNCASCTNVNTEKKQEKKAEKRRDIFRSVKKENDSSKECYWERMDWNTEITVQNDHSFDFKQYMNDPNFQKMQDVTVYPVTNVQFDNAATELTKKAPVTPERTLKKAPVKTTPMSERGSAKKLAPFTKNMSQNKIQKSIQQAILKNQEKYKFIQNTPTPPKIAKPSSPKVPTIISSGTINRQKITKLLPQKKLRQDFANRVRNQIPSENFFDKKYKAQVKLSGVNASEPAQTGQDDKILNQISQTVQKSQDEMQRYIELVEQKFIKTFSLPETEKATAYTTLESEIKQILNLINTTKEKKKRPAEKPKTCTSDSPRKTLKKCSSDKEKITPRPKKQILSKSPKSESKKCSTTSVIVLKKPQNITSQTSEMGVVKKKSDKNPQPTICTDHINFIDSLTAIATKTNSLVPEVKQSASILKTNLSKSSSVKSVNKKVRFKLDSDSSVTMSTDEEYSTQCEETVSEFSSDQEISKIIQPNIDIAILLEFKLYSNTVYPIMTCKIYYLVTFFHQTTLFDLVPENYDLKIFSAKGIDFSRSSNFEFDDLKPSEKDSVSVFIENCEEIIQATKNLELKRHKSPDILEFLQVITSLSIQDIQIMSELYYQNIITYIYVENKAQTFKIITYYRPIVYNLSQTQLEINESVRQIQQIAKELEETVKEIKHNPDILTYPNVNPLQLQYLSEEIQNTVKEMESNHFEINKVCQQLEETVDEIEETHKNKQIREIVSEIKQTTKEILNPEMPTEGIPPNNSQLILFDNTNSLVKFPNLRLGKHLSEPVFSTDFFRCHINFPLSNELVKCPSDLTDRNLNILTYESRKKYEDIYQTLVLNLQVNGCGENCNQRNICKKKYVPPLKNKMQIKEIKVNFEVNTNKLTIEPSHKVVLIFLYITVFSLAFLCMTQNYNCE